MVTSDKDKNPDILLSAIFYINKFIPKNISKNLNFVTPFEVFSPIFRHLRHLFHSTKGRRVKVSGFLTLSRIMSHCFSLQTAPTEMCTDWYCVLCDKNTALVLYFIRGFYCNLCFQGTVIENKNLKTKPTESQNVLTLNYLFKEINFIISCDNSFRILRFRDPMYKLRHAPWGRGVQP